MMCARYFLSGLLFLFLSVLPPAARAQWGGNGIQNSFTNAESPAGITLSNSEKSEIPAAISFIDWLREGDSVTIVLETDFRQLKEERLRQEYQPMMMTVVNGSNSIRQEGKVRTRGHFRCKHCDLPPVKVKIPKKEMARAGFEEWNEFKLVMPCKKGKEYEQYVLKEYLVYRLYNVLTDRSFRVRHLNLRIQDFNDSGSYSSQAAFLIEHKEELEYRIGGAAVDSLGFDPRTFSKDDYNRLQVFQFMVGNTDWMPVTAHNMDIIQLSDGSLIPVPFDFDFSGLVSTNYATPNPYTGLSQVRSRIFMGNRKSKAELEKTFELFRSKEDELISTIARFEPLDFRERKRMIRYLQSFFKTIDNPKLVRKRFLNRPPFVYPMY